MTLDPQLLKQARSAIEEALRLRKRRKARCPDCGAQVVFEIPDVEERLKAVRALVGLLERQAQSPLDRLEVRRILVLPPEGDPSDLPGFEVHEGHELP